MSSSPEEPPRPPSSGPAKLCMAVSCFAEDSPALLTARPQAPASPAAGGAARRKREFTPEDKKDNGYWDKRRKNNEAAKRSREKRRVNDLALESRVLALLEENARLKAELLALKFRFGLIREPAEPPRPAAAPAPYPYPLGTEPLAPPRYGHPFQPEPGGGYSEDSGFSTPGSSSMGSPVFFEERDGFEGHCLVPEAPGEAGEAGRGGRYDPAGDAVKSLPHKLRFKMAAGPEEMGGEAQAPYTPSPPAGDWRGGTAGREDQRNGAAASGVGAAPFGGCYGTGGSPPLPLQEPGYQTENGALRSQLASLSAEVAQLKKFFSEQILVKMN
ncbi:AN1-type zinc finger protein 2A [Platysternon megacephalum]|uniref:AN1-type zinc finger protein 2A n=1 Tax=Platysternon megacephalum TaxID=55544 RepID=A0A4D9DUH0_9SAUR|nr:AN1-type zinc finger protein 2A [Platysternon megacephalum]